MTLKSLFDAKKMLNSKWYPINGLLSFMGCQVLFDWVKTLWPQQYYTEGMSGKWTVIGPHTILIQDTPEVTTSVMSGEWTDSGCKRLFVCIWSKWGYAIKNTDN